MPVLVLGSTQPGSVVRREVVEHRAIEVLRRRSGGGAVLLTPGGQLWIDIWVPRADPLWNEDVLFAAEWIGDWWAGVLRDAGVDRVAVHHGGSAPDPWAGRVCFAGIGAGEVLVGGRKLVGVAQWRARQGALFHCCAYRSWKPVAEILVDILELPSTTGGFPSTTDGLPSTTSGGAGTSERAALEAVACGIDSILAGGGDPIESLLGDLLASLPGGRDWAVTDTSTPDPEVRP